jgi:cyclic pyranopterin phosphate synthase
MVDVSAKAETARVAVAEAHVRLKPATVAAVRRGRVGKGNVEAVAKVAGIQAAKRTPDWIPMAHPVRLDAVDVAIAWSRAGARVTARAAARDRTGVEMEALVAAAASALAIYDMTKALDRGATISLRLLEKRGGRSGAWRR